MGTLLTCLTLYLLLCLVGFGLGMTSYMEDTDLTSFVTRPELKVPRLVVTKHHPDLIEPGYIFMAPYVKVESEPFTKMYQPCQVGPSIYDLDGELVWTGACLFSNRNPYDFKLNPGGGEDRMLSVTLGPMIRQPGSKGQSVMLGPSLEVNLELLTKNDLEASYMHEFTVLDDGKTGLFVQADYRNVSVAELTNGNQTHWFVRNEGFREIDLSDASVKFDWWAMDHIPIEESPDRKPLMDGNNFDVYHINSIERTAFGHYIVSMRHTNTIYMVSGQDGHIMWRLGGKQSSFVQLDPLVFSGQHDARIISEDVNGTIVMSFFDNGGATNRPKKYWTAKVSSVVLVQLDTASDPMTVKLLRKYERPDKGMTVLRGNARVLPDGHVFAGWSSSAYFSEFAENGSLLMEGHLGSNRMSTYRTFKYGLEEVKLSPSEPIALLCRTVKVSKSRKLSIMYVSWNGATEVTQWEFAVAQNEEVEGARFLPIGKKAKRGFETVVQLEQSGNYALVYGLDRDGNVLGKSEPVECEDVVEACYKQRPQDLYANRRPPGVAGNSPPAAASDQEHKEVVAGAEPDHPKSSMSVPEEMDNKQERPPTQNSRPNDVNVHPIETDRAFGFAYTHRDLTAVLFLSMLLAGLLLVSRRVRRRLS